MIWNESVQWGPLQGRADICLRRKNPSALSKASNWKSSSPHKYYFMFKRKMKLLGLKPGVAFTHSSSPGCRVAKGARG